MQGEGGAIRLGGNGDPTWRICGSVTAANLGNQSPPSTVSTNATGEFTLKLPAGTYQLVSSNTVACSFLGKKYSTPPCVEISTCYEATPAPVVVLVTAGHESYVTLNEEVP